MSSPFKRFGRALGSLAGGLKQKELLLPAGMTCPQPVVAHPQTGQLILQEQSIQPEEGMYSVFSLDGVEILVRYSKILAYTLPQGPSWKDTGMVYVSPKLEALNLRKGASFTVFVGRMHYLVTVIEELAKALPTSPSVELTRLPEEKNSSINDITIIHPPSTEDTKSVSMDSALDHQLDPQQDEHNEFLTPEMAACRPLTPPNSTQYAESPPKDILKSAPISDDPFRHRAPKDKVNTLQQAVDPTMIGDTNIVPTLPISPTTPKRNLPEPGRAPGRYPLINISNSKGRSTRAIKYPPSTDSEKMRNFRYPTIATEDESREASPSPEQRGIRPHPHRFPTYLSGLNEENHLEPNPDPQASRFSNSRTSPTSRSSSSGKHRSTASDRQRKPHPGKCMAESQKRNSSNIAEPSTSRTPSTDTDSFKSMSNGQSLASDIHRRGRCKSGEKSLPKLPTLQNFTSSPRNTNLERERIETRLLTPKVKQPQSLTEEHYYASWHGCHPSENQNKLQPVPPQPQARPPPRSRSSSLLPLNSAADEIFVPNTAPRNVPPVGTGRKNRVEMVVNQLN